MQYKEVKLYLGKVLLLQIEDAALSVCDLLHSAGNERDLPESWWLASASLCARYSSNSGKVELYHAGV